MKEALEALDRMAEKHISDPKLNRELLDSARSCGQRTIRVLDDLEYPRLEAYGLFGRTCALYSAAGLFDD